MSGNYIRCFTRTLQYSSNSLKNLASLFNQVILVIFIISGLYYKPTMIINDDSSVINKLEDSFIDDARAIINDRHMFIVQAADVL